MAPSWTPVAWRWRITATSIEAWCPDVTIVSARVGMSVHGRHHTRPPTRCQPDERRAAVPHGPWQRRASPTGTPGRQDLALYASFTLRRGKAVFWYPDRKSYLRGRVIGDE
jgi:hypothetical protein